MSEGSEKIKRVLRFVIAVLVVAGFCAPAARAADAGARRTTRAPPVAPSPSSSATVLPPAAGAAAAGSAAAGPVAAASTPVGSAALAASAGDERTWASCLEHLPTGATPPALKEQFPTRGLSGHALVLRVEIEHGKGETVMPQGVQFQRDSDAARAIAQASFIIPEPDGGAAPSLVTTVNGGNATTVLTIDFVALPPKAGRARLTLPPVPVAIARASGELLTVCTKPHDVTVEDPTASIPDAKPQPNPEAREQREEWTLAKQITLGALAGAVLAAIVALLVIAWRRRPKRLPPPTPPRPPWEVAIEELYAARHAGLVAAGRLAEHFDRVSDAVRKYLGGRFGFDGLETTTDEMAKILSRVRPAVPELGTIKQLLRDSDLVKFARFSPTEADCASVLDIGEHIVRSTMPVAGGVEPPGGFATGAGVAGDTGAARGGAATGGAVPGGAAGSTGAHTGDVPVVDDGGEESS